MEFGPALLQVSLALVATVALVLAIAWLLKRVGGGALRGSNVIRVVAAAPLGTRERIMLVEVHGRQLLIGVTQQHVTTLHAFGEDTPSVASADDFGRTLRSWMKRS